MRHRVTFLINKEAGKPDGRLRCRVRWDGNVVEMLVGYRVNIAGWSTEAQRCRRNTFHHDEPAQKINLAIDTLEQKISAILKEADTMTKEEFREKMGGKKEKPTRAVDAIERFVEEEGQKWTSNTAKRFAVIRNRITEYQKNVTVSEMGSSWLNDYMRALSRDHVNSTVNKEMKLLRWFLRWADRNGYETGDFESHAVKLKTVARKVIFLDRDELMRVYRHEFKNLHLDEVRDVFCFQSFTGMRYSDVKALRHNNIKSGMMSYTSIKDHDQIDVELNSFAREILAKYRRRDKILALPVCNMQEANETLKRVMKECEVDEVVTMVRYRGSERIEETRPKYEFMTTHCARRTFIVNALSAGVSPVIVMKWTGHASYNDMKPYIDIADRAKADAMAVIDKRMKEGDK